MSIVLNYENQTIQHGDIDGNIAHQGILASNITGTTPLTATFPTTSTGDSLGHYHYTESGTNALKFLNVAGSGSGGHKFYTANSTSAPVNTASIGLDGLTIETTSPGPPILLPLPNVQSSIDIAVIMSSSVAVSPYNMGPANTFWPVQVNSVCTNMIPGVTYYAKYFNGTTLQMNSVFNGGDGTIIDSADLASRPQPILSLVTGTSPGLSQMVNLFENLTITNDTDSSALTATELTFNNINVKMNQFTSTLIYSSPLIYADGFEPATSLTIRNTYGYSGWYFKNLHGSTGGKINWYFPAKTPTTTPVSALKGISISFFNGVTTSNDDTLFITIYTVPTGSGDIIPGFAHSSNTYVFDQTIQPTVNTNYQGVCILDILDVPFNYETQIQYSPSTVNNPRGSYLPTDTILAVVIATNSTSVKNSVELVVNKLNLHYADFTQSYLLIPP
jgi:hypothetical protein